MLTVSLISPSFKAQEPNDLAPKKKEPVKVNIPNISYLKDCKNEPILLKHPPKGFGIDYLDVPLVSHCGLFVEYNTINSETKTKTKYIFSKEGGLFSIEEFYDDNTSLKKVRSSPNSCHNNKDLVTVNYDKYGVITSKIVRNYNGKIISRYKTFDLNDEKWQLHYDHFDLSNISRFKGGKLKSEVFFEEDKSIKVMDDEANKAILGDDNKFHVPKRIEQTEIEIKDPVHYKSGHAIRAKRIMDYDEAHNMYITLFRGDEYRLPAKTWVDATTGELLGREIYDGEDFHLMKREEYHRGSDGKLKCVTKFDRNGKVEFIHEYLLPFQALNNYHVFEKPTRFQRMKKFLFNK